MKMGFKDVIFTLLLIYAIHPYIVSSEISANITYHEQQLQIATPTPTQTPAPKSTPRSSTSGTNDICMRKACIQSAYHILENMDESIDPCDNFYDFACGNFIKNHIVPDEKLVVDVFSTIADRVREQLRVVLTASSATNESRTFALANKLYSSCMNKDIIEEKGIAPLQNLLNEFGGWPAVLGKEWNGDHWDWVNATKAFRKRGLPSDIIFNFAVDVNYRNSTTRIIDVDQPHIIIDREILLRGLEEKIVKAHYAYMVDVAIIFGADQKSAEKDMLEVIKFETAIANISWPKEERRNGSRLYNLFTIKETQVKYPYISWLEYIRAQLPIGIEVDENDVINVSVPSFFEKLGNVLQSFQKRTIANYFMWHIVFGLMQTQNSELRRKRLKYRAVVFGIHEDPPRWQECADVTSASLPIAIGAMYIRKHFDENSRQIAVDIVGNIRHEFEIILQKTVWIDNETRNYALDKAKAITNHIAYPSELNDDKKTDGFYEKLELESDGFVSNILRIRKFNYDRSYSKLYEPVNKTNWETHAAAAVVNAFYAFSENSIRLHAAILQERFFDADRPLYLNYAGIGQVIGHEITHAFDDRGRQHNAEGNLIDWWQSDTKKNFLDRAQCIIEQYASFRDPLTNLTLNGINTQAENIADNGGIKVAYKSYLEWVKKNGPEARLPGLNYTTNQLFWLGAAQPWCSIHRKEAMKLRILTGLHSPPRFRVLGPNRNSQDFAKDFHCPVGSYMNPEKKCEVW